MRKEFYGKLLPSQGVYCVAGIDRNGFTKHHFVNTLDEVESSIVSVQERGQNVFVALSSFSQESRKGDAALFCKSFFIDLDVGEGDKKYSSKEEALADLDSFVESVGLPPPIRIDSGNGVHAYWILDRDVPVAEWKVYATKFKNKCLEHLKIDPAVTADVSRILRCPETLHLKGEPKLTKFLDTEFDEWDYDVFTEFLGQEEVGLQAILAMVPKGLDEDTKSILKHDNYAKSFRDIAEKSINGNGCAQIKHILINAATLEEPLWYAGLSIARHCDDWEEAIHLMSEDHPDYSPENTVKKAEQANGKPQGCDTFEKLNPGGCDGCPFKNRITNPLYFGRSLKESPTAELTGEDLAKIEENPEEIPVFPQFLKPFVRGVNGGVYYVPTGKGEDDEDAGGPICLSVNDLFPIKRMFSSVDGECMVIRHAMRHDPTREFLLPMSHVYIPDMFKKALAGHSVAFELNHIKYLQSYMIKWNAYLQSKIKAEIMRAQMGWTEARDAFVIGLNEVTDQGDTRPAAASPMVRNISKLLKPQGSYEDWKASVKKLDQPGFELHAFGLLCGFGSPLMSLTATSGVSVSFYSTESGTGKTGAMYAGLSVWGDPKELSIVEGNATDNAFVGRLLNLKNIMYGIDEATNADSEIIARLSHRISQGKAKLRMQASVNAERELELTASLICVLTTNKSLYEKLQELKASPDGEVARIVEFEFNRPFGMTRELGTATFDPFRHNYGFAGPEFIKAYYKLGEDEARRILRKWQERVKQDFGDDPSYRFYESLVASCFAAGEIACDAGIIDLNLDRIYKKVITDLMDLRDNAVRMNPEDYRSLLGTYCNDNQSEFLIFDDGKVVNDYAPRRLIGRIEMDADLLYLSKDPFNRYIASKGVSVKKFLHVMKDQKLLIEEKRKRLGAGYKATSRFNDVKCYVFNCPTEELIDELRKNTGT